MSHPPINHSDAIACAPRPAPRASIRKPLIIAGCVAIALLCTPFLCSALDNRPRLPNGLHLITDGNVVVLMDGKGRSLLSETPGQCITQVGATPRYAIVLQRIYVAGPDKCYVIDSLTGLYETFPSMQDVTDHWSVPERGPLPELHPAEAFGIERI